MPLYGDARVGSGGLARTEEVAERIVTLPLFPTMAEDDVEHVIASVRWALEVTGG
jgi:dTDP-4-amino-4,6-dideoxygalactose transaminase